MGDEETTGNIAPSEECIMETHRLKKWTIENASDPLYFFTCARPGRSTYSYKRKNNDVSDTVVSEWVRGLPTPRTAIVSLLGRKPDRGNQSEFSFYSFSGGWDTPSESENKPTFQEWLKRNYQELQILVRGYPTNDLREIPPKQLVGIADDIRELISKGHTVVLMDSGGVGRIGQVCTFMNATEVR